MEQKNQVSSEVPSVSSLLILNDDCLADIFKFLPFEDFFNLAETYSRLFIVAQKYKKFKNIKVTRYGTAASYTVHEFSNILSVIGEHVVTVRLATRHVDIFNTIADNCTNLRSVELGDYSIGALPFRNLKELIVGDGVYVSTEEWKNFFANNAGIESLEYWDDGRNKCIPLLQSVPELKSLKVNRLKLKSEEFHHLSCLTNLAKLSFTSTDTCNQLLIELAKKLHLVELELDMPFDAATFVTLQSFLHLEVLSMLYCQKYSVQVPEATIFPSMLKKIKLGRFEMSYIVFLSIVKQLKLLDEFDIGKFGTIYSDNDEYEEFPAYPYGTDDIQDSKILSRIDDELRVESKILKIIFTDVESTAHQVWQYSENLEIIKSPRLDESAFDHTFHLQ